MSMSIFEISIVNKWVEDIFNLHDMLVEFHTKFLKYLKDMFEKKGK